MTLPAPFALHGADMFRDPRNMVFLLAGALLAGVVVSFAGIKGLAAGFLFPGLIILVAFVFLRPLFGMVLLLVWAFVGVGIGRYVNLYIAPLPLGLGIDALLLLTAVAVFLREFRKLDLEIMKQPLIALVLLWFVYTIGELANPEAPGIEAWFYASRGMTLYMVVAIPLGLWLITSRREVERGIVMWLIFSVGASVWGIKQLVVGLDAAELLWLSEPGNMTTHMLFGKLRVFSFLSDSGQFGAAQGHASLVALLLALDKRPVWQRILLAIAAAVLFYGMLISGTRGAMMVVVGGAGAYLLVRRNWRVIILGIAILGAGYAFLKFTYIGQDVYEIRRMRTALDPDNASFQVRLDNQKRLLDYVSTRPFGGGVGSAGYWGGRFNAGTFLGSLALDSWYVRILAEQGPVGLLLYLVFLGYVLIGGYRRLRRIGDPHLAHTLTALYCGIVGIAIASYGNQVWGQMPTGIVIYASMAALFGRAAVHSPEASGRSSKDPAGSSKITGTTLIPG